MPIIVLGIFVLAIAAGLGIAYLFTDREDYTVKRFDTSPTGHPMTVHLDTHDPVLDWQRCLVCSNALSAAFATLADMDLGPNGSGRLVEVLRREAEKAVAHGAAS